MYVTPTRTVTRKAARRNNDDNDSDYSDDSMPPRKRGKKEDVDANFMGRYYRCFLRSEVNANERGPLQRIQRDNMHPLFTKLKGTCKYITEIQGMRAKWDCILRRIRREVYLQVPE